MSEWVEKRTSLSSFREKETLGEDEFGFSTRNPFAAASFVPSLSLFSSAVGHKFRHLMSINSHIPVVWEQLKSRFLVEEEPFGRVLLDFLDVSSSTLQRRTPIRPRFSGCNTSLIQFDFD